ncbi:Vacuolar ATP synthase catalytic subunit-related / V-ATPase-related / vacuolar proton pump-related [Hibiscus syriacus]|uniref:RING-type E3 ubiquitin transferase n=1 Tax=Hibiscus syriacus TaxID=106335 RepID=A0A6A2XND1_HIBSY|nr:E3 ubiquitin-protein ligase SIRP1-like [Hibiscus syriacus]KAE8677012.1 Vacuolar ATP synthase catalytic subunit-related / V-ATPase-related / vacuolar proton pump-related [Hibiscus syriacus]
MGERVVVGRYWCYICSQMVNPTMEAAIKCPFCESGFLEEITSIRPHSHNNGGNDSGSISSVSIWAPILLGLIGGLGSSQLRLTSRAQTNDADDPTDDELGREFESLVRRRRRGSGSGIRMLQDTRTESENIERGGGSDRAGGSRMILFDLFNDEALIVQGSFGFSNGQSSNPRSVVSFSHYLLGPGWDLLLQYLSENDLSRHGSPPAKKEAVEAMPNVTIDDNVQCCVCLEDIEMGSQAKEMPCKHKFHGECIIPWLELHSSCPVCRFLLPSDGEKVEGNSAGNGSRSGGRAGNRRRYWIPIPWPSEGLVTLSGSSQTGSSSTSTASLEAMPGNSSGAQTDDN